MNILDIKNCTICYQNGTPAVSDVSLSVSEGEIVSIVGESGSGKTTLIRAVLGLLPPGGKITGGEILFDGMDLVKADELQMQDIRGKEIAMIFQDVGAALDPIRKFRSQYEEAIAVHEKQPKHRYIEKAVDMLKKMIQAQVVHQMKELRDKYGVTIILVTHNMGVASYLSDKIGVMCRSRMVEFGTRDEIIYHPKESYTKELLEAVPKLGGERFAK